jgi:hypothetical protein
VTCTGGNGTSSANATVTFTCAASYSCSGQTIRYTNTSCVTSDVTTCTAPSFCSEGAPTCLVPPPSGHLQVQPRLIRPNSTVLVTWNISNASSCSVSGSNGDSWTGTSSGAGKTSAPLSGRTVFTLSCIGLDSSNLRESIVVNLVPTYDER